MTQNLLSIETFQGTISINCDRLHRKVRFQSLIIEMFPTLLFEWVQYVEVAYRRNYKELRAIFVPQ